jgi:Cys-tRNA(Pro) deacylase
MPKSTHVSETPATQWLKRHCVPYREHVYEYVEHGGTAVSSQALGVDEHAVIKTLVMQDEGSRPLIVLMHGDRTVSTKNLARQTGRKTIEPCRPDVAQRHTGFLIGGTSPFGTRRELPVFVERSILDFLVAIEPHVLIDVLHARPVECALGAS